MKKLLMFMMLVGLLAACGNDEVKTDSVKEPEKTQEKPKEVKEKVTTLKVSEPKVSFSNFTFEIEKQKLKDNKLILDTLYTNDSFPGEKSFMAAAIISVTQGDVELEEVSGVKENPKGDYFYKNETGIWVPITFEYELNNTTDDVIVTIIPTDFDDDDEKTITISFE